MTDAVDLFGGPGGWAVAMAAMGLTEVGIENAPAACATRRAAGHQVVEGDILRQAPGMYRGVPGLVGGPPCQTFSKAGKGSGRHQLNLLVEAIAEMAAGRWPADIVERTHDPRTALVLQPLRWAHYVKPRWIAMEQVPSVLPVWEEQAKVLATWGYSTATGIVNAEQYGVPQTRRRAVMLASLDREVVLPVPTHSRYYPRDPAKLDDGVLPWVSMGEALSMHPTTLVGFPRHADDSRVVVLDGQEYRARDLRAAEYPSLAVTSKARSWRAYTMQTPSMLRTEDRTLPRTLERPSFTVAMGHDSSQLRWVPTFVSQSGTPVDEDWPWKRPSTTVAGRDLVQNPGATANRFNGSSKSRNDGVRVAVEEAAVLQSFPADYPWQGTQTQRYTQVGDAIPPLLARALLEAVGAGA